ncbi:hypothetical protein MSAN_01068400 [Mycena sanguinolenta]|uniref:Uncharacterized protein n=1 Tax=Mycena sanguinolenta TaxID=230812 RepID=A0A8H6YS01_9AGAR|nr:hypothetical protein MSAN_01068400 [Mycena sanguinolenta]
MRTLCFLPSLTLRLEVFKPFCCIGRSFWQSAYLPGLLMPSPPLNTTCNHCRVLSPQSAGFVSPAHVCVLIHPKGISVRLFIGLDSLNPSQLPPFGSPQLNQLKVPLVVSAPLYEIQHKLNLISDWSDCNVKVIPLVSLH